MPKMSDFSNRVIELLEINISGLIYELEENGILRINQKGENGFTIRIGLDENETIVYYGNGGHHEHWSKPNEFLQDFIGSIIASLIGEIRQVTHVRNGNEIKWESQILNENNEWQTIYTSGKISFAFWKKKDPISKIYKINSYSLKGKG